MRNQLVYDLPLRIFHWVFAGLFVSATLITKFVDDESLIFSFHMLAGLLMVFTVALRILWGVVGTKHSRFTSLALNPRDLVAYFMGILSGNLRRWAGHNPASSWAALLMLALALGLGLTGYLMATGQKEDFEDIHELLANGFLIVALLHVAGVALHAVRHRDGIALSMVDGAKQGVPETDVISKSSKAGGLVFVGLLALFVTYLATNFNPQTRTLQFLGSTLQLGENEGNESANQSGENHENEDED